MSIPQPLDLLKTELEQKLVPHLLQLLTAARANARPLHQVEQALWDLLLETGHRALQAFFEAHGTGDQGPTLTLDDGRQVHRLEELHTRR
jgi:hypothetical protein